ncbi:MAG: sugar kinase, ribokinase [Planctomycetaceae bacterium]|nr:sugar kinase, ribokinase [Planctomycetaceae bacterium]
MSANVPFNTPCIIGLGEILWDMLPSGTFLGGAPANFAFHANQLGARGHVVSAVGNDDRGQGIVDALGQLGLTTVGLRRVPHPTSTVTVTTVDGQPSYTIHTDVAWDFLPFDDELKKLAQQADAVCFGSLAQRSPGSRHSLQSFLRATRQDCCRVFDINLRQHYYDTATIQESLALSHVLKLNHEELPIVADLLKLPSDPDSTIRELLQRYGLRLVALTRGGDGSSLCNKWRVSHHPGHRVEQVADTVGAGDSFTAALVMGLLHQDDLDVIHDRAARLASFVCTQRGATPRIPDGLRSKLVG